jgi:hypothetical protein
MQELNPTQQQSLIWAFRWSENREVFIPAPQRSRLPPPTSNPAACAVPRTSSVQNRLIGELILRLRSRISLVPDQRR